MSFPERHIGMALDLVLDAVSHLDGEWNAFVDGQFDLISCHAFSGISFP
jgi:hypothetical protein